MAEANNTATGTVPGDKKVNGRRLVLQMLDSLLAEAQNIRTLRDAFQTRLDQEPLSFFKEIVMPTMPKDMAAVDDTGEDAGQTVVIQLQPKTRPAQ